MEDQLYVRIRGRVQGPFDKEKLRALVKRGQLSRMHEVSPDGNDWKQASEYQELFATEVKQVVQESEPTTEEGQPIGLEAVWYYSVNGIQAGPVTFEQLQAQAAPGHLASEDLVWKEGMKEWVPGATIPGLLFGAAQRVEEQTIEPTSGTPKLGGGILRTLKDSQAWVRFITINSFFWSFVLFVTGMILIIGGILIEDEKDLIDVGGRKGLIAIGIAAIFYTAVIFYNGWLLNAYRKQLGNAIKERSAVRLDRALRTLRTYWIYSSIVIIVAFINVLAAVVWELSDGTFSLM